MVHVGRLIRDVAESTGISATELASRLNCHRQNIYKIYDKADIDTFLLRRISAVLRYDFFKDLSQDVTDDIKMLYKKKDKSYFDAAKSRVIQNVQHTLNKSYSNAFK